jgi:hypothetical protein
LFALIAPTEVLSLFFIEIGNIRSEKRNKSGLYSCSISMTWCDGFVRKEKKMDEKGDDDPSERYLPLLPNILWESKNFAL